MLVSYKYGRSSFARVRSHLRLGTTIYNVAPLRTLDCDAIMHHFSVSLLAIQIYIYIYLIAAGQCTVNIKTIGVTIDNTLDLLLIVRAAILSMV